MVEEYRILDSVNNDLATSAPAEWVRLSSRASSAALFAGNWLVALSARARPFRGFSQARPCCLARDFVRRPPTRPTVHSNSHWKHKSGSSRAWPGSASSCRVFAEGEASLARSASLDACPLALPVPCVSGLLSGRLKLGFFFFCAICPFLFSFWTVPLTLVLSCQHVSLEIEKFALCDSERRVGKRWARGSVRCVGTA